MRALTTWYSTSWSESAASSSSHIGTETSKAQVVVPYILLPVVGGETAVGERFTIEQIMIVSPMFETEPLVNIHVLSVAIPYISTRGTNFHSITNLGIGLGLTVGFRI